MENDYPAKTEDFSTVSGVFLQKPPFILAVSYFFR